MVLEAILGAFDLGIDWMPFSGLVFLDVFGRLLAAW